MVGESKMKTSVIVCTRNRLPELLQFTHSLAQQSEPPDEYLIVDSSDTPINQSKGFTETMHASALPLTYIRTTPGLTHQRNVGIKHCQGEIIYFFDDDIILAKDYLQIINQTMRNDPDCMGAMGDIANTNKPTFIGRFEFALRGIFLLQRSFGDGKFRSSGLPRHPYGTHEAIDTEVLGGCLMAYRKVVFDEFSFDDSMTGYSYMEDVDFSRRVSYTYKLRFNPKARCEHRHTSPSKERLRERCRMFMVNHRYLFDKNFLSRGEGSRVAHYWSIAGILLLSILFNRLTATLGYIDGLIEFHSRSVEGTRRQQ